MVSEGSKHLIEILDAVRDCRVGDVRLERPTLENVFLHHTGHGLKAGEEVEAS